MDSVRRAAHGEGAGGAVAEPQRHRDLTRNVTRFCRRLRARELLVTPTETIDALRAFDAVDITDRGEVYLSLRGVLTARPEDLPIFDQEFEAFWGQVVEPDPEMAGPDSQPGQLPDQGQMRSSDSSEQSVQVSESEGDAQDDDGDEETLPLYSPVEVLGSKDFSKFRADEMREIARAIVIIARKLATRESRRTQMAARSHMIDPRRTVRRNMKYGGTIIELAHKKRKIRKPRIVLICDVSRSMDSYSRFLLQFIYALQHCIGKVESFVFSTSLTRVTPYFKSEEIQQALDRIADEVMDWSGGTRIGQSLQSFNKEFSRRMVDRHTIVLVLSDGLDTGDADILEQAMDELSERAGKVIWLNPLLGSKDYRPLARGMSTALRHVDVFAPAHNLASLQELGRHLTL